MAELQKFYGAPCHARQVNVTLFGHTFPFLAGGADALLRAAMAAYDAGYDVYSIWAFNCRPVTGGGGWSAHAWAAAVDINPDKNPYSSQAKLITNMPAAFVKAFTDHGFGWGGNWHSIKDPMHFSLAPDEQGSPVDNAFQASLQQQANAKWAGKPIAPKPQAKKPGQKAPPWHHAHPGNIQNPHQKCDTTAQWQQQMKDRKWDIDVDGVYGPKSETVCRAFQREKGLATDGILGPSTWACAWQCPMT